MELSLTKLKNDIIGEKEEFFLQEFKGASNAIDDLKKRPNCSICIRKVIGRILDDPKYMVKLVDIYGEDDITLSADIMSIKRSHDLQKKIVDTVRVPMSDWEDWINGYANEHSVSIKFITTAYDTSSDEMIVTVIRTNPPSNIDNARPPHMSNPQGTNPYMANMNIPPSQVNPMGMQGTPPLNPAMPPYYPPQSPMPSPMYQIENPNQVPRAFTNQDPRYTYEQLPTNPNA